MEFCDQNKGEELLNVSVEIAPGQKDILRVFEHDDLQLVVRNFFIKNNIVDGDEETVLKKVNEFMEELIEEHKLITQALAGMPYFTSPVCKNFGERLYRKCLDQKEIKIVKNQMERIWKARKIQEGIQDRPKIDKKSVSIVSNSICKSLSSTKGKLTENESSVLRLTPNLKEIKEALPKNENFDVDDFTVPRRRTMELKPVNVLEVDPSSTTSSLQKRKSQNFDSTSSDIQKSKALLKITQHVKIGVDQSTGSKVFKPVQLESPIKNTPIGTKSSLSNPSQFNSVSPVKVKNIEKPRNSHSNKQKRYLDLFIHLKPKNEDTIDPESFDLSKLNEKLVKIILPLLMELKKNQVRPCFGEFSMRMDVLIKGLNPVERNVVLMESLTSSKPHSLHKQSMSMGSFMTHSSLQNSSKKCVGQEKTPRLKNVAVENSKSISKYASKKIV